MGNMNCANPIRNKERSKSGDAGKRMSGSYATNMVPRECDPLQWKNKDRIFTHLATCMIEINLATLESKKLEGFPNDYLTTVTRISRIFTSNQQLFLYLFKLNSSEMSEYVFHTCSLQKKSYFKPARSHFSFTEIHDNRLICIGGQNGKQITNRCDIYNIATDKWSSAPALRLPRLYPTAFFFNNSKTLYAAAGKTNGGASLNSFEKIVLDSMLKRTWVLLSIRGRSYLEPSFRLNNIILDSGKVMIMGGPMTNPVIFDPKTLEMTLSAVKAIPKFDYVASKKGYFNQKYYFLTEANNMLIFNGEKWISIELRLVE